MSLQICHNIIIIKVQRQSNVYVANAAKLHVLHEVSPRRVSVNTHSLRRPQSLRVLEGGNCLRSLDEQQGCVCFHLDVYGRRAEPRELSEVSIAETTDVASPLP